MADTAYKERSNLYTAGTRGIEIIRTGLRNIAAACEQNQLPSQYRAPVLAKYDISSQSSTSNQAESWTNKTVLGMGYGFGKALMHNPSQEFLSQIKSIPITCKAEMISRLSTDGSDCARIVNDIRDGIDQSRKSLIDGANVKCVFTKKILPVPSINFSSTDKSRSVWNEGKVRKKSPHGEFTTERRSFQSSSDKNIKTEYPFQDEDLLQHSDDVRTSEKESETSLTSNDCMEIEKMPSGNDSLLTKSEPSSLFDDTNHSLKKFEDLNSGENKTLKPDSKSTVSRENDLETVTCSKPGNESLSLMPEEITTKNGINRKRPRPRRSNLNTDRKMWMSRKSPESQMDQESEDQGQSEEKDNHMESRSPADMLVKVFGYDPSKDAFRNVSTDASLPLNLSDVQVPVFNRQQIYFIKNSEDECIIVKQGSSSTMYLASKDGKNIIVKDSSRSYRSAENVMREARILSILDRTGVTPRLLGVLEQGLLEKEYCIVQDKSDGFLSLTEIMKSGYYFSRSAWMRISLSLTSHLQILHYHKVLHNNICSDNILVNKDNLEVVLVGFGQASYTKGIKLASDIRHSLGLSPEVKHGCITSPQSDVYALGSVLKQLMLESRVMDLHEVVLLAHQDLPKDRPRADLVLGMIKDIYEKLCLR